MTRTTNSPEETEALAAALARELEPGTFLALRGDLGAGKTVFVRGLAKGLGYEGRVLSPSFTLMRVYAGGRLTLYHFDVYRLNDAEDLAELDFEEYALGDGVCVTEWAERIEEALPQDRLEVTICGSADEPRRIVVERCA